MYSSGRKCAISGKLYEKKVSNIAAKCLFQNNQLFHLKEKSGNFSPDIDLICSDSENKKIGIEIKKARAPDWQQCKLRFEKETRKWVPSAKEPKEYHTMFKNLLHNCDLYDGQTPPFLERSITHEEWKQIKKNTTLWNDVYIDIPDDTIKKMYQSKGCHYIQIGNGYGLYHLGKDVCGFNVPEFIIPQQIRIRTKIHVRKNKKGFCSLSVMAACQPKNISVLQKSPFSLDDTDKLPTKLFMKL